MKSQSNFFFIKTLQKKNIRKGYKYTLIVINQKLQKIIMSKAPLDIVCIDETKLDESFPDFQFHMGNYQFPPHQGDRNFPKVVVN